MRRLGLLGLFWLPGLAGQTSPVPYDALNGGGLSLTNRPVAFTYPGAYSSLRNIDFRNFKFQAFNLDGKAYDQTNALRNGRWRPADPMDRHRVELKAIYNLRRSSPNHGESALALLTESGGGGSSYSNGIAQVLSLLDGYLRVTQEMTWDTHFWTDLPTELFDTGTDSLLVRTAHYMPGDAHCCVSAMDVIRLKWDGRRFVQTSLRTELSKYGRTEGKKLPR